MLDKTIGLNENQKKFVGSNSLKILLIACAGAGKTLSIVRKVGCLLDKRIAPENIFCISFTRTAANELSSRISKMDKKKGSKVNAFTFHSFAIYFIKKYINPNYSMLSNYEQEIMVKKTCNEFGITEKVFYSNLINDENIDNKKIQLAINSYTLQLERCNKIDINIVLSLFKKLLLKNKDFLMNVRNEIEYLFYDEAQDLNKLQYDILEIIIPPSSEKGLVLIGDDDQNIYEWNGTDIRYILGFKNKYNAEVIVLNENYRCSNQIIDKANKLISNNQNRYDKYIKGFFNSDEVAYKIFKNQILANIDIIKRSFNAYKNKYSLSILCRSNKEVADISHLLTSMNINHSSSIKADLNKSHINKLKFVLDVNSILVEDVFNITSAQRLRSLNENKSIFTILLEDKNDLALRINKILLQVKKFSALKSYLLISEIFNFKDNSILECLENWANSLKSNDTNSLENFLSYLENSTEQDRLREKDTYVNVTTIHGAKGLEFDEVIIYNFNNKNFNLKKDCEETRRLIYVAITRAKKRLVFYYISELNDLNKSNCKESSFLNEIF